MDTNEAKPNAFVCLGYVLKLNDFRKHLGDNSEAAVHMGRYAWNVGPNHCDV